MGAEKPIVGTMKGSTSGKGGRERGKVGEGSRVPGWTGQGLHRAQELRTSCNGARQSGLAAVVQANDQESQLLGLGC